MSKDFLENRQKIVDKMSDADREEMMKDFKMPSMDELRKMVDSMRGLTEEQREKLREQLMKRADFPGPSGDGQTPAQAAGMIAPATSFEVISLIVYLIMVTGFIGLFGKIFVHKPFQDIVRFCWLVLSDRKRFMLSSSISTKQIRTTLLMSGMNLLQ